MQSGDISEQAKLCSEQGNQYPTCFPTSSDILKNGSTYDFIWNFNYPFYVGYEQLSLYLYYYIKFEYVNVKNFTNLDRSQGSVQVTVDDSWFLTPLQPSSSDVDWTLMAFYLPSTANVTEELTNPYSMYPRPFNFTITQTASLATTTPNNTNETTNNNHNNNNSSSLPGWAIAVIVISIAALICGILALFFIMLISRRTKNDKRRRNNKLNPILKGGKSQKNITAADSLEKQPEETASINSRAKMTHTASAFFRSTDSVPTITVPANASTVGSFTSSTKQAYYYNQSMIPPLENDAIQSSNPFSPTNDSIHNRPSTSSTLTPPQENGRSLMHWNDELVDEEVQRRKLGEALLQRQLQEDGTSVKHAGRFTRVKSLADIQKSAIIEQS